MYSLTAAKERMDFRDAKLHSAPRAEPPARLPLAFEYSSHAEAAASALA